MAVNRGGKIVTDGLVFCSDFGSKRSYNGIGNIKDLVGNNNCNLVNAPEFGDDRAAGYFIFDGTNDGLTTTNNLGITGASERTYNIWFYYVGGTRNICGYGSNSTLKLNDFMSYSSGGFHRFILHCYGGGADTISTLPSRNTLNLNNWNSVTVTYDGNAAHVYTNGVFSNSKSLSLNTTDSQFKIGLGYYSGYNSFNSMISSVKIYNRSLSAQEIKQNYNSTRGRFE